ncbi:MAG: hypothetical protein FWC41_04925 [Firmicutes bacterium]|nr:hypothetical protein [Bacillota bacterium]
MSTKEDVLNFCELINFISSKYYESLNKKCIELINIRNEQNEKLSKCNHETYDGNNEFKKLNNDYNEKFDKKWEEYQFSEIKNEIIEKINELNISNYFTKENVNSGSYNILKMQSEFEFDSNELCFIMQQLDNYFTIEKNTQLFSFILQFNFRELDRNMQCLRKYFPQFD